MTVHMVLCNDVGVIAPMPDRTLALFGIAQTPDIRPDEWAATFGLHDPWTGFPLDPERVPGFRLLMEGQIKDQLVLVVRPDGSRSTVRCDGECFHDDDGNLLGAMLTAVELPPDAVLPPADEPTVSWLCPCDAWGLEIPLAAPAALVREVVAEHLAECVVLGAVRHLALTT